MPPALLSDYTEDQLRSIVNTQRSIQLIPCHTQAVERGVNLITESSDSVYGYQARHGYILNKVKSRCDYKTFPAKKNFVVVN